MSRGYRRQIWWGEASERPYGSPGKIDEFQLVWRITPIDAPSRGPAVDPGSDYADPSLLHDSRITKATSDKSARL